MPRKNITMRKQNRGNRRLLLLRLLCSCAPLQFPTLVASISFQQIDGNPQQKKREDDENALAGTGTSLAGGLFVTLTPTYDRAAMALDLRAMHSALHSNDVDEARQIYLDGRNSPILNSHHQPTGQVRSLASLSTDSHSGKIYQDADFLYQIYGLANGDADEARETHSTYGHDFIMRLFDNTEGQGSGGGSTLAAEAALVLNVHQAFLHELQDTLRDCSDQMTSSTTAGGDFDADSRMGTDGLTAYAMGSLDAAVALYVGSNQVPATPRGYALYALTERTAELFHTMTEPDADGTSLANLSIQRYYEEARSLLSQPFACVGGRSDTYGKLYHIVNRMTSVSFIPLVQMLLMALVERDEARIELYSLAVVPRLIACSPSTHRYLTEKLLNNKYDPADYRNVVTALQSTYDCLGFKCSAIGSYMRTTSLSSVCQDTIARAALGPVVTHEDMESTGALAEWFHPPEEHVLTLGGEWYHPTTPVRSLAKIDLDVRQMQILSEFGDWRGAEALYAHGKNSNHRGEVGVAGITSLRGMATTNLRFVVHDPWIGLYRSYHHREDMSFADTLILQRLRGTGKWETASTAQRAEAVVNVARNQIVWGFALYKIHNALNRCNGDSVDANDEGVINEWEMVKSWDEAAALTVGSMERGNNDGQLLYTLANDLCDDFGTCSSSSEGEEHSDLANAYHHLFYAGKKHLAEKNCTGVELITSKLRNALVAPLVQATVRAAAEAQHLPANSPDVPVAQVEGYGLSILPLVAKFGGPDAATVLERNIRMREDIKPVQDGAQAVADAVWSAMRNLNGEDVGGGGVGAMCTFTGSRYRRVIGPAFEVVEVCGSGNSVKSSAASAAASVYGILVVVASSTVVISAVMGFIG